MALHLLWSRVIPSSSLGSCRQPVTEWVRRESRNERWCCRCRLEANLLCCPYLPQYLLHSFIHSLTSSLSPLLIHSNPPFLTPLPTFFPHSHSSSLHPFSPSLIHPLSPSLAPRADNTTGLCSPAVILPGISGASKICHRILSCRLTLSVRCHNEPNGKGAPSSGH